MQASIGTGHKERPRGRARATDHSLSMALFSGHDTWHVGCRIESVPPVVEAQSLNQWTTREGMSIAFSRIIPADDM